MAISYDYQQTEHMLRRLAAFHCDDFSEECQSVRAALRINSEAVMDLYDRQGRVGITSSLFKLIRSALYCLSFPLQAYTLVSLVVPLSSKTKARIASLAYRVDETIGTIRPRSTFLQSVIADNIDVFEGDRCLGIAATAIVTRSGATDRAAKVITAAASNVSSRTYSISTNDRRWLRRLIRAEVADRAPEATISAAILLAGIGDITSVEPCTRLMHAQCADTVRSAAEQSRAKLLERLAALETAPDINRDVKIMDESGQQPSKDPDLSFSFGCGTVALIIVVGLTITLVLWHYLGKLHGRH